MRWRTSSQMPSRHSASVAAVIATVSGGSGPKRHAWVTPLRVPPGLRYPDFGWAKMTNDVLVSFAHFSLSVIAPFNEARPRTGVRGGGTAFRSYTPARAPAIPVAADRALWQR